MENIKIAIDCHNLEGNRTGVGRYLWNLLREWTNWAGSDPAQSWGPRSSLDMEFFLYFKNEIPQDIKELASAGFLKLHIRVLGSGSNAFHKHFYLPRAAARDKVDMLFCPDYVLPFYMGFRKPHIKTAVTLHDIIYEARPSEYSWPSLVDKILLKWASKQSAKKADVIFCPSDFTKNEIVKYYEVNREKVRITKLAPDPIFRKVDFNDDSLLHNNLHNKRWETVKSKYGIDSNFIIFVGSIFNRRFLPQKIEGFTEFAKNNSDFKFLIIGKNHTSPFQDVGSLISKANNELKREAIIWIEFLDDDNDLAYFYNKAYVTLWLSSYEGFGLPLLESMACGTPVITSKTGALPEVAGESALYIDKPGDSGEISNTLNFIARNKNALEELSKKGLERARMFSWEKAAKETMDAISNAL